MWQTVLQTQGRIPKIKAFPGKQKLKEFITTTPAFQQMLKEVLQVEMEGN